MMRRTIGVRRLHHRMVRRWAIDSLPALRLAGTELAYWPGRNAAHAWPANGGSAIKTMTSTGTWIRSWSG